MNLDEVLRFNYGCSEETARIIKKWYLSCSYRDRQILEGRLEGKSMREIGREMGLSHPTISSTIDAWTDLRESLEDATIEIIL